jgi:hypothetical protein
MQVLEAADSDLRTIEILARVEDLLGESVSRSSVKNYVARVYAPEAPLRARRAR